MGHEFAGTVSEAGNGWKKEERVTSQTTFSTCGRCFLCNSGNSQLCPEKKVIGIKANGAFASKILVPPCGLHKLPPNISFEEASITEIGADVVYALNERAGIQPGNFIVIFGPGPVGIFACQIAKASGAEVAIVGTQQDRYRLGIAKKVGANHILYAEENPVKEIKYLTNGNGADISMEASGSPAACKQVLETTRNLGKVVAFGIPKGSVEIPWNELVFKGIEVIFHLSSTWTSWEKILALMSSGKVTTKPMIKKFKLKEWEKAFEEFRHGRVIKAVLIP
jgi:L-iditol 2-dehydrogenase